MSKLKQKRNRLNFSLGNKDIQALLEWNGEWIDLDHAASVLSWDREVNMPPQGAKARSFQLSTLSSVAHEKLTNKKIGKLLEKLAQAISKDPQSFTQFDQALVLELTRDYDKAVKIPKLWVNKFSKTISEAVQEWKIAKEQANYNRFSPQLEKIITLLQEQAEYLGYQDSPYDALLDQYEPNLTEKELKSLFTTLKAQTQKLLAHVNPLHEQPNPLEPQPINPEAILKFTKDILQAMGYDFKSGRQDISEHPFTTSFGYQDVRITTKYPTKKYISTIMASIHEGGHALHSQGVNPALERTVLEKYESLALAESQSRLWENMIGKSEEFWEYWYPKLATTLQIKYTQTGKKSFLRHLNQVKPVPIRIESDELTYNLHIILRFELESELIKGALSVKDLPNAWNDKMEAYLGIRPQNDSQGVLQDIHWAWGSMGYFPTYTLGNIYASELYEAIKKQFPNYNERIQRGELLFIREWLKQNIHSWGRAVPAEKLLNQVTDKTLSTDSLMSYLSKRYAGFK